MIFALGLKVCPGPGGGGAPEAAGGSFLTRMVKGVLSGLFPGGGGGGSGDPGSAGAPSPSPSPPPEGSRRLAGWVAGWVGGGNLSDSGWERVPPP